MRYLLKEQFILRGWEKLPFALVDQKSGWTVFINASEMDALKL